MIKTKEDLHFYLAKELGGAYYSFPKYLVKVAKQWLRGGQALPLLRFHYSLRHFEYYKNQTKLSMIGKIKKHYWRFVFRHCQLKYGIYINPNQCGYGLRLCHPGYRYFHNHTKCGNNVTVLPMVMIGDKSGSNGEALIGNNVEIAIGSTILLPVKIGNNVRIGAGAVVTKDIPDNSIVAGVPAKIIRQFNEKDNFLKDK